MIKTKKYAPFKVNLSPKEIEELHKEGSEFRREIEKRALVTSIPSCKCKNCRTCK